jgi:hypothetical protein
LLGSGYQPRDTSSYQPSSSSSYQPSSSSFIEGRSRALPEITSSGPYQSDSEGRLQVSLRSLVEHPAEKYSFLFTFEATRCPATLTKTYSDGRYNYYSLSSAVPPYQPSLRSTMALLLEMQDENHAMVDTKDLGLFSYQPHPYQRKRKLTSDTPENVPAKRVLSQPLQTSKYRDSSSVYPGPPMSMQAGGSYSSNLYSLPSFERQRPAYSSHTISSRPTYYTSLSPNMAPSGLRVRRSPVVSQAYGSPSYLTQSQSPRMTSQATAPSMSRSSSGLPTPRLVRTSTLKVSPPTFGPTPSFNPYHLYPDAKATLEISGDLQSMCEGWSREEREARRRLVEFSRSQSGSLVTVTFKAVSPDEYQANSPCVSCIYWERKKQYYVTSVDTIALLEHIIAIRFTVEEKNRVRRNLEGFKPHTVSKAKDEYDDIFKLIMGFPNPKPRNIEKDIKIFPWPIMEQALKKIVGKYVSCCKDDVHLHQVFFFSQG